MSTSWSALKILIGTRESKRETQEQGNNFPFILTSVSAKV